MLKSKAFSNIVNMHDHFIRMVKNLHSLEWDFEKKKNMYIHTTRRRNHFILRGNLSPKVIDFTV